MRSVQPLVVECRWEFEWIEEKNVSIVIYEKGFDLKRAFVFQEDCHIDDLLKALVHGINRNAELRSNEKIEQIYQQFKLHLNTA